MLAKLRLVRLLKIWWLVKPFLSSMNAAEWLGAGWIINAVWWIPNTTSFWACMIISTLWLIEGGRRRRGIFR